MATEVSREKPKLSTERSIDSTDGRHQQNENGQDTRRADIEMDDEQMIKEPEIELVPAPPPKVNAWFAPKNSSSDQKVDAGGKSLGRREGM